MTLRTKNRAVTVTVALLNALVLISSLLLVGSLSYSILNASSYAPTSELTLQIQLWVCTIFIIDFLFRLVFAQNRTLYLKHNFIQLLFAIPYINIVLYLGLQPAPEVHYLMSFIPLLRGGYGLVMIARWFTKHSTTSLLISYLSILTIVTYFTSLIFFVAELHHNPSVVTYWDALWWACMDMTTVGSNVVAVTPIGKVLSVLLAASGMMMLPIFTVYITDKIRRLKGDA